MPRLIYALPEGIECLISTSNKRTMIRDKFGNNLGVVNTLLPEANTILQGVYNKESKTVYLTDLLLWDNQLFIESTAETRWSALIIIFKENVSLSSLIEGTNDIRFRLPQIMDCSKVGFDSLYYGLCNVSSNFPLEYEKLINFIQTYNLLSLIKVKKEEMNTSEGTQKICCLFGTDNTGEFYLKDGIAFIHKQGLLTLGYSEVSIKWKDNLISPYYNTMLQEPMLVDLFYDANKNLVTHDGFIVDKLDPNIEALKINQVYRFSYSGIYLNEPHATLTDLKYQESIDNGPWSSMDGLVFKFLSIRNMLPYKVLVQQLEMQEGNLIH